MKKIVLMISFIVMAVLVFLSLKEENTEKYLTIEFMSEEEYKSMVDEKTQTEINSDLLYGGITAPYDSIKDEWYFYGEVPMHGIAVDGDYQLAWFQNEIMENVESSIANNDIFTLIVYNDLEYSLENVKIATLPIVSVSVPNLPTGKYLYEGEEISTWEESGTINFYGPSVESEVVMTKEYPIKLNVRGVTAQAFDKKPYKINIRGDEDLSLDVKLSETRKDNDWVLNAIYSDRSRMREKYVTDLWREILNAQDNPQITGFGVEYVELIVNDSYQGLYLLSELIDAKQENINRETDFIVKGKWPFNEKEPIIEELRNTDSDALMTSTFEVEYIPENGSFNVWSLMANYYQSFEQGISIEDASSIADIENQIDYALLILYATLVDNDPKNIFYIGKKDQDDNYIIYKELWDLNYSMGDVWSEDPALFYTRSGNPEENLRLTDEIEALLKGEDGELVKDMMIERWSFLRESILSEEQIIQDIDNIYNELMNSGGLIREYELWLPNVFAEDEINRMKDYTLQRVEILDEFIISL